MNKSFRSIYINGEKRKTVPVILYVLFVFLGSTGTVFSFDSCFDFNVSSFFYLGWIIAALGISLLFLNDKAGDAVFFLFLLVLAAVVILRFRSFAVSFIRVCNIVIKGVNASYRMELETIAVPYGYPRSVGESAALAWITVLVTVLTAYFVLRRSSVIGSVCATVPLTILGIFFDIFPKLEFLLLSVTFWIVTVVLYASGRRGKRTANGAVYNGLYAAAVIWILYGAARMLMPQQDYVRPAFLEDAKQFVENNMSVLTDRYDFSLFQGDARMGIGQGEFGSQEEIRFSGERMLEVTLPPSGENVYLRTREYNFYAGNSWENNDMYFNNYFNGSFADSGNAEKPQNFTPSILKNVENELSLYDVDTRTYEKLVTKYRITVRDFTESDLPFAPYGAVFDTGTLETDIMPVKKGASVYEYEVYTTGNLQEFCALFPTDTFLDYWNMISAQLPTMHDAVYYRLASNEKEYAAFVRKAYTQVPEELSGMLKRYAPETVEYDCVTELEFAGGIQQMFEENFTYTLAPGKVPAGMDGVDYFLNESRQGYCVYFASAATLIFRQAGIPARYVEGFVITQDMMDGNISDGMVTVTVPDDKAHAWTEIYIAGYGWVPIEVTPGYYRGNVYAQQEEPEQNTREQTDESAEEETTEKVQEETAVISGEQEETSGGFGRQTVRVLLILTGILAVIFGLYFVYELMGREQKGKIHALFYGKEGLDNNERAFLAWWYIEELLSFRKVRLPDNLTVAEQKQFINEHLAFFSNEAQRGKIDYIIQAYFGNTALSDKEADDIGEMARQLRAWFYEGLTGLDKIKFQYIHRL